MAQQEHASGSSGIGLSTGAVRSLPPFICPVCGGPLTGLDRALRCARGHSFDRAREGYVNLLPAGHGRSKRHGDSAGMLVARRRFLERGYYEPIARAIEEHGTGHLSEVRAGGHVSGAMTIVEAGCGEGYYIGRLARSAASARDCFIGFDISRPAVRMAARAHRNVTFIMNDVHHGISLADSSVDLLLNIFAPRNPAEFGRVMRPGGLLMVTIPGEGHLRELRALFPLLGIEPGKRERTVALFERAFSLVGEEAIEYRVAMDGGDAADLLAMTPNFWHVDEASLAAAAALGGLEVTIACTILRFHATARRSSIFTR